MQHILSRERVHSYKVRGNMAYKLIIMVNERQISLIGYH